MEEDIFRGNGVEIKLANNEAFLKIKETLTRIGVASKKEQKLYQSCHILHKRGRYSIMHFKELFLMDNKQNTLTEEDIARRNTIINLLEEWGLLEPLDYTKTESPVAPLSLIKVIPFKEKTQWSLESKYSVGKK